MLTTLTCVLALSIAAPAIKDPPKKDAPSLIGRWAVQDGRNAGNPLPISAGEMALTFEESGTLIMRIKTLEVTASYKIDVSKNPAEIDFIQPAGDRNHNALGIFKIEGDTLTIYSDDSGKIRPASFDLPAGNTDFSLFTFKRVTAKAK
jgi:uncharacterized protein (TIGR03067 family)